MIRIPRIAVIGCGQWGRHWVRNLHEQKALSCLHDTDVRSLQTLANTYKVPIYGLNELWKHVDGVVIATSESTHALLVDQALDAGKHVFVEKPMTLTLADAMRLRDKAKHKQQHLMVGHLLQYHSGFLTFLKTWQNGHIGKLRYGYAHRLSPRSSPQSEGVLWDLAPHDISMALSLFGDAPLEVEYTPFPSDIQGRVSSLLLGLRFAENVACHIFVSWNYPQKTHKWVLMGEKGSLVFDDLLPWDQKVAFTPLEGITHRQTIPVIPSEPLSHECTHFIACIQNGYQPKTDADEGVRVMQIIDRALNSYG